MKKWLPILLFLIPSLSYAQDCTKGQNVTFAQLPANPAQFTSCHQTDATSCTQGSPPGSGGSTVCFVLWSGTQWVAGFQTPWSGPNGGSGPTTQGIGGGVANTCGADNYCNVLNFGAKSDLSINQGGGAMDNNVTSTLTDTTNHPFAAGDVGKIIGVDGAVVNDWAVGTITGFTSSSVVTVSFNNTSGSAISAVEYWYGTDNKTAIQLASTTAVDGQTVWIPAAFASSDGITKKPGVSIAGPGGRVPWWILGDGAATQVKCANFATATTCSGAFGTSIGAGIAFLSKTMTKAGISEINAAGLVPSQRTNTYACNGLTLWAGVGMHFDGGGTGIDGINLTNVSHEIITKCNVVGFKRDNIRIADSGTAPDYSNADQIIANYVFGAGGNGINLAGVTNLENTKIEDNEDESNQLNGIDMNLGAGGSGLIIHNNVVQWNNMSHTVGDGELKSEAKMTNVHVGDNWFEHQQTNDVLWAGLTSTNSLAQSSIDQNSCIGSACVADYPAVFYTNNQGVFDFANNPVQVAAVNVGNFDTTSGDYLACFQAGALGATDAEKRSGYMCSVASGVTSTHATGKLVFATNNAGTLTEQETLWPDGGLSVNNTTDIPGAVFSTKGVGSAPIALASAACSNEGLLARQSNSTAACSSGATATFAGTVHCFIGCNGTNWIQFGF